MGKTELNEHEAMTRHLAIGDIHGCLDALQTLVEFVGLREDDRLVTLGDYINRGPDTLGVLDWLVQFSQNGHLIAIKGNHEAMLLDGLSIELERYRWLKRGRSEPRACRDYANFTDTRRKDLKLEHWEFLFEKLVAFHETETHFFVHGSVDPSLPLHQQPEELLFWGDYKRKFPRHISGKIMVCGHKLQSSGLPATNGNAICIDTGACKNGWLTCLDSQSGDFWQANQSGDTRRMNLSDLSF